MQAYLDLAWAGLVGTSIYKRNYPNDQNHKNYAARGRIEELLQKHIIALEETKT
jgi:hypothetical protein